MTVAEFIEWLKTQPQDAEVRVLHEDGSGWEGSTYGFTNFEPSSHADLFDARGRHDVLPKHSLFNRCVLDLGGL